MMHDIRIPGHEFQERIAALKRHMQDQHVDVAIIYGDEYRKENLRYISNYWPLFERGAAVIGTGFDPILLCAPEGEQVAREMSGIKDVRLIPDFLCVTVPDEIEYPLAHYTSFSALAKELPANGRIGLAGGDAMPAALMQAISRAFGPEIVDLNDILQGMRLRKSRHEIACLEQAARLADIGYRALMQAAVPGNTELFAAGAAEGAARAAGAEAICFMVFGSGLRTHTIIGRPTNKVIEDGDMIMAALAVQYEGYVASVELPFVAGRMGAESKRVIETLVRAELAGLPFLKAGVPMGHFVRAVKGVFQSSGLARYDVYPPLHGCGCAEAESPYPNESTTDLFEAGMTVNTDISLFGLPGGSNRIEEGYVITDCGARPMSSLVREYCAAFIRANLE